MSNTPTSPVPPVKRRLSSYERTLTQGEARFNALARFSDDNRALVTMRGPHVIINIQGSARRV